MKRSAVHHGVPARGHASCPRPRLPLLVFVLLLVEGACGEVGERGRESAYVLSAWLVRGWSRVRIKGVRGTRHAYGPGIAEERGIVDRV